MQLKNIILSLAAVAVGVINAAPAPSLAAADAQTFGYSSCMTVAYDTPQGIAFYDIQDPTQFQKDCKTCIEATKGCGTDTKCKDSKFGDCSKSLGY